MTFHALKGPAANHQNIVSLNLEIRDIQFYSFFYVPGLEPLACALWRHPTVSKPMDSRQDSLAYPSRQDLRRDTVLRDDASAVGICERSGHGRDLSKLVE